MLKNAGESKSLGFEIEALARPIKNLTTNFSIGYTSAKFVDYVRDESKDINHNGNYLPYVPLYTFYAGVSYRIPLYRNFIDELRFNANLNGIGRIYWDDANTITQDPYQLLNLRVDYQIRDITLGFWARNVLDTNYTAFQFSALGHQYAQPGNPRLFGMSFTVHF
jgi:iron complex outermembrane receptor protein